MKSEKILAFAIAIAIGTRYRQFINQLKVIGKLLTGSLAVLSRRFLFSCVICVSCVSFVLCSYSSTYTPNTLWLRLKRNNGNAEDARDAMQRPTLPQPAIAGLVRTIHKPSTIDHQLLTVVNRRHAFDPSQADRRSHFFVHSFLFTLYCS